MLGLRAGAWFNFIFGRQYAGIPREIDATDSVSLAERAPVVVIETVMESYTVVVPKTTTVEITYHVPLNTSSSATSATLPFASTAISNSTSAITSSGAPADTPLFAINPSLLLGDESQQGELAPTTTAQEDAVPETSDADVTRAPTETAAQPTTEEIPSVTPDEARLDEGQDATSEVLLLDSASLTFSGPSPIFETTLLTVSGSTTAASAPDSTQSSEGIIPDDSETGITDPRPSLTTATLPGGLITTIGLDPTAGSDTASETEGSSGIDIISQESNDTPPTPVIVGSVVGSFMGLSVLVFLLWFLRRRTTRRRRSTLLTPLGLPLTPEGPGSGSNSGSGSGGEKYEIDNHSLGPTPRSTKLAAAVTVNAKKFGRRLRLSTAGSPHVNMNRGNSQFLESTASHSRSTSMGHYPNRASSSPEVHQGWWSRLIQESSAEDLAAQDMVEKGRETTRTPSPNPFSDANAMARGNPYSDASNMSRGSLVPPPLAPGRQQPPQRPPRPDDPFADSSSIAPLGPARLPQSTYVADVQRSRGPSTYRNLAPEGPAGNTLAPPMNREALRDNIHSNPFDLELDGRHVPSVDNIHPMPRYTTVSSMYSMPKRATTHSRAESFTSRYTSGVSMAGDWPPMPNGAARYSAAEGYPPVRHSRSESDGVLGRQSVGQAM